MNSSEKIVRSFGKIGGERMVCQLTGMTNSKGVFYGNGLLRYSFPALMVQFVLIFFTTQCIYYFIKPLRQSMLTAQILAGIILGPSLLARSHTFTKLFMPESKLVMETFANSGFMFHALILGLQFDPNSLKKIGRRPAIIGFCGTVVPLVAGTLVYRFILGIPNIVDKEHILGLFFVVGLDSMTSFIVITSLLMDLNILNSEIGRLAASTSLISDFCGWLMGAVISNIISAISYSLEAPLLTLMMMFVYYLFMFIGARPLVIRLVCYDSNGKQPPPNHMNDGHFLAIVTIVLGLAYLADVIGQHWVFAAFIFGVSLPAEPPLNSVFVQKLHTLASGVLLPVYCTNSGLRTDIREVWKRSSLFIELVIAVGYVGKFMGTILPALYFGLPLRDASSLALIMCSKGIIEIAAYCLWMDTKVSLYLKCYQLHDLIETPVLIIGRVLLIINRSVNLQIVDEQVFALLIINMISAIGVSTPIVAYLYDPSRRYMKRSRSNLHKKQTVDLRLLVCIHGEENVPTIINLLEASNPTRTSPVTVFVLQLTEMKGLTTSVLTPVNQRNHNPSSNQTQSDRIVNAFRYFERHSQGPVVVQHFTAIAPYSSMHDDICNLALDKRTSIVIIPYHKHWAIDATVEAIFPSIRSLNQNVILKAPCSVGVLIDRGQVGCTNSVLTGQSQYRLVMLYIGGEDDREGLEYSKRMANHPNISLTVVWLRAITTQDRNLDHGNRNNMDIQLMREFQAIARGTEKLVYREETVKDGIGTTQLIRSMDEAFDMFIVGMHHNPESRVILGLTEWSECPELGIIGDMLASSDFQFSVLVVQQS